MDLDSLHLLNSGQGIRLLDKYGLLKDVELESLMFKAKTEERGLMRAVVSLLKLRRKAKDKFVRADKMFFSQDGQEQSTGEKIARYIASRYGKNKKIVDLTCSIGGNTIFFAQTNKVVAVDRNQTNLECARLNAQVYGVIENIDFILGEASENIPDRVDAFFMDPERAREGRTKTRSIFNSSPKILELLPAMLAVTKNIGIKISPAFDYSELTKLPEKPEVEIISEDNVCKVAMLWFGDFKTCNRRATCLAGGDIYSFVDDNNEKVSARISSKPLAFIYEPDKAIIKAHLIDEIAEKFGLQKLNPYTAYLTGDKSIKSEKIFRVFKVKDYVHFSIKTVLELLKKNDMNRANIATRRFPVEVEDLYKTLKIKEGSNMFLLFTVLSDEKRFCILCEKVI